MGRVWSYRTTACPILHVHANERMLRNEEVHHRFVLYASNERSERSACSQGHTKYAGSYATTSA